MIWQMFVFQDGKGYFFPNLNMCLAGRIAGTQNKEWGNGIIERGGFAENNYNTNKDHRAAA